MRKIQTYQLNDAIGADQSIDLPESSEVLGVVLAGGGIQLCVDIDADPDAATEPNTFRVLSTGSTLDPGGSAGNVGGYIGTIVRAGGVLRHVFQVD